MQGVWTSFVASMSLTAIDGDPEIPALAANALHLVVRDKAGLDVLEVLRDGIGIRCIH